MDAPARAACAHCELPVGRFGRRRELSGDALWFCCAGCSLAYQMRHGERDEPEAAAWLIRLGVAGFLAMNIMLLSLLGYTGGLGGNDSWLRQPVNGLLWALATPLVLIVGGPFFAAAWQAARRGGVSADTLVTVGVAAAYGYSAWAVWQGAEGVYFDTVSMVLILFTLGRTLEAQGRLRAMRSLVPMLQAQRAEVRVVERTVEGDVETLRPVTQLRAGELVRVLPGERIAVDGIVVAGRSACDESVLTGRQGLQAKTLGAVVRSGSLNGEGPLWIRATVAGSHTRWIQIGRLVREALAAKSLSAASVDRAAALFLPAVLLLAAGTTAYWSLRLGAAQGLLAGLSVLVVACPCSLGLAASIAQAIAIGAAAQRGILVRGGGVLERLAALRGIAFDKTGTLTQPTLEPASLATDGAGEVDVLRRACALAQASDHPAARGVLQMMPNAPAQAQAQAQEALVRAGAGVRGRVDGQPCAIGSAAWMAECGCRLAPTLAQQLPGGCTPLFVGWGGRVRGLIALRAVPLPEAGGVIGDLRARGLEIWLLSGDEPAACAELAPRLGIAHWQGGLNPEGKIGCLQRESRRAGPFAMVGDGLNDGPVLAAAAVGIAVGDATDLAKESADVVLPRGALAALPWLLQHAAQVRRAVRHNLAWAFGYNAVALGLAASGVLQPVMAAALMAGSSLLVVWRSWRAERRWTAEAAAVAGDAPSPVIDLAQEPVREQALSGQFHKYGHK
jgi:P-type Cu2+ transporter